MKVLYRQTASDDIVRQFRYYLVTAEAPEIALRFREAVRNFLKIFGANELLDRNDLETKLIPTLRLVACRTVRRLIAFVSQGGQMNILALSQMARI